MSPEQTDQPAPPESPVSETPVAPVHPDTVSFKADGETREVPWDEALGLMSQGQDYTKKMQNISEVRQAYAQQQEALQDREQQVLSHEEQLNTWQGQLQDVAGQLQQRPVHQAPPPPQQQPYRADEFEQTPYPPQAQYPQQQFQPMPEIPAMPEPPVQEGPDRIDQLEARVAGMGLEREIAQLQTQYECLNLPQWKTELLVAKQVQPDRPSAEIAQQIQAEATRQEDAVVTKYLATKNEAEAAVLPLEPGAVRTPPTPPGRLSFDGRPGTTNVDDFLQEHFQPAEE